MNGEISADVVMVLSSCVITVLISPSLNATPTAGHIDIYMRKRVMKNERTGTMAKRRKERK